MSTDTLAFVLPEDFTSARSSAQLINQNSGDVEYYTDPILLIAANDLLGRIDLDPASSHAANKFVRADIYFSKEDNGLAQAWFGKVWMNHPFSREENPLWINKLLSEYRKGNVKEALCITFAATSEKWFQPLAQFAQCYLSPRTNYFLPDGTKKKGVTKGSVITYLGPEINRFARKFKSFGVCKYRIQT